MDQFGERFDDDSDVAADHQERDERHLRPGIRSRAWIIALLLAVGVLAYMGEKYSVLVKPGIDKLRVEREIESVRTIEENVLGILETYGISDQWIRKRVVSLPDADSVRDAWTVSIPPDVPVASITHDLNMLAEQYQGRAYAVEDAKTKQIFVHVKFRDMVRYSLLFQPTAGMYRREGRMAILVDGLEDCGDNEIEEFINSKDPVGCLLIPGRASGPLYERIRVKHKDILLQLHFFTERQDVNRLAFSDDLGPDEIRWKVRNIVKGYASSGLFFITSERAPGANGRLTQAEFEKQGFTAVDAASLFYIDRTSEPSNMTSRMNDLAANAVKYGSAIGVVKLEETTMDFLHDEMVRLRKKGLDFVSLRSLMERDKDK